MQYFFFFLAILLVTIFQTTIFGFNFLLALVLISALAFSPATSLTLAFLVGFILDLFSGGGWGYSSLGFVLISFLVILYRQRFSFQNPLFVLGITLVSYFLFSLVGQKTANFLEGFFLGVLVVILRLLAPFLFKIGQDQEKLKLAV